MRISDWGSDVCSSDLVQPAIRLRTRATSCRALGWVQDTELNARAVDGPGHDSVEGVDLAHQVTFAEPADRRVARHRADRIDAVRQQQRPGTDPGGCGRSLAAGMAAADEDAVVALPCPMRLQDRKSTRLNSRP